MDYLEIQNKVGGSGMRNKNTG